MSAPTFGSNPTDFPLNWESATQAVKYTVAKMGAAHNGALLATANTVYPLGIIQNDPKQNEGATVRPAGRSYAVAGAAIALGDRLTVDGSGRVIAYTRAGAWTGTSTYTLGTAMSVATAADQLVEVLIHPSEGQD